MKNSKQLLGHCGEEFAAGELQRRGYKILGRNVRTRLGELDIVARDGNTLCFVEIKTRRSTAFGFPQEAVTRQKQWHITRMAQSYMKANGLTDVNARFDVVAVLMGDDKPASIEVIQNAFEAEPPR